MEILVHFGNVSEITEILWSEEFQMLEAVSIIIASNKEINPTICSDALLRTAASTIHHLTFV